MARTYEVYLRVEKYFTSEHSEQVKFFFPREDNLRMFKPTCNFPFIIDRSVSKITLILQCPNKGMTSAISSLVRIWKICHSYPGCSFI